MVYGLNVCARYYTSSETSLQSESHRQESLEEAAQDQPELSIHLKSTRSPSISHHRDDTTPTGQPFVPQSVHSRDGRRIRYIINDSEEIRQTDLERTANISMDANID
jgi:hypothetical protein